MHENIIYLNGFKKGILLEILSAKNDGKFLTQNKVCAIMKQVS